MRILIACEESQAVCIEFRKLGHEAYSCDTQKCSGGHPEWHIHRDVLSVLNGGEIQLENGELIYIEKWDMMCGFPPCTHLAVSGAAWFEEKRKDGRQQDGIDFFMKIVKAPIKRIAIENPVGIMSSHYQKPDQIIQPYYFGDKSRKTTCLWLKNLPPLFHSPTMDLFNNNITHVEPEIVTLKSGVTFSADEYKIASTMKPSERGKARSKTFPGIAKAMAKQWG